VLAAVTPPRSGDSGWDFVSAVRRAAGPGRVAHGALFWGRARDGASACAEPWCTVANEGWDSAAVCNCAKMISADPWLFGFNLSKANEGKKER